MTVAKLVPLDDTNKFCALIGHVCLQWALLELTLLGILSSLESVPTARAEIMFGGLDMLPRCNMAINLARHHRWPGPMINRLEKIRKALQGGLSDRRNQAVHGAHAASELPEHVRLRMVRWRGDKNIQHVSLSDMHELVMALAELAKEADSIWKDYGTWKFGDHRAEHVNSERTQVPTRIWFKVAENVKPSIDHVRGWFRIT